jgi:hypothetical protein
MHSFPDASITRLSKRHFIFLKAFKKIRERQWKRKQQSISQVSPGRRRQQGPIFSSMIQDDGYRDYLYFRSESV